MIFIVEVHPETFMLKYLTSGSLLRVTVISLVFLTGASAVRDAVALAPRSTFGRDRKGRVSVPLTAGEEKALTPAYLSVNAFRRAYSQWRKEHPRAKLVWMVRHGESYSNVFDLTQHPESFSPLTPRGQRHAVALADFLQDFTFDQILSSNAERAYRTVREPAGRSEGTPHIQIDTRLQEFAFWPAGNMPLEETRRVFANLVALLQTAPQRYVAPGQVSMAEFKTSLGDVLREIMGGAHSNILLGTHGMTIVLAVMEAFDLPLEKYWAAAALLPFSGYAGITVLACDADSRTWELLVYADSSYLPEDLKGKKPLTPDLEQAYYRVASERLDLLNLRGASSGLGDFFPSEASFTRLSPAKVKAALEAAAVVDSSA